VNGDRQDNPHALGVAPTRRRVLRTGRMLGLVRACRAPRMWGRARLVRLSYGFAGASGFEGVDSSPLAEASDCAFPVVRPDSNAEMVA